MAGYIVYGMATIYSIRPEAICALVVYFLHSTRPKIQSLASIIDRQFVTVWVRE